jgi:hypothetical protein
MSKLKKNPFAMFEDKADPEVPTATLQIYEYIHTYLGREDSTHINRASSATLCPKRRWYQKNGCKGESLTPRKVVNFLQGDLAERSLKFFVEKGCVGPGKLYSEVNFGTVTGSLFFQNKEIIIHEQESLTAKVGRFKFTAHVDGWGRRNIDNKWELIEFKSAANYGFSEFKKSGPKDYLKQAHVAMQTTKGRDLRVSEVRFFYLRKETGHLWDSLYHFDRDLWREILEEAKIANGKKEPKAPFPKYGNTVKFPCTYCPYLKHCHGEYTIEWKNAGYGNEGNLKPNYIFNNKEKK